MNKLVQSMLSEADKKYSENGAAVFSRPNNSELLTLFGVIGALRPREEKEIEDMFKLAYFEDADLATRMLFYAGDIRGGLGERRTFVICLRWLANNFPNTVKKNIMYIPFFNRFDVWYALVGTKVEEYMWAAMRTVFSADILNFNNGDSISLLAKWMKSINTSSAESRKLARKTMKKLKFSDEKSYRKILSTLRGRLRVVEKTMSANQWGGIDYQGVPSYAMKKYHHAFAIHDSERYAKYLESVQNGKAKINSGTLYPYDIVREYLMNGRSENATLEAQWKALPDYVNGDNKNILCMVDVSPSMLTERGRPMATSIGLGIYFAERNKGAFKNLYLTFSSEPSFIRINPLDSLYNKVRNVRKTGIGYSTNLFAAFGKVLELAVKNKVPQSDLPSTLLVISDCEIDRYQTGYGLDFVGEMRQHYANFGYIMPKLVFWQVESRQNTFISQSDDVQWVSGQSTSVFRSILEGSSLSSYDLMLKILNGDRYAFLEA